MYHRIGVRRVLAFATAVLLLGMLTACGGRGSDSGNYPSKPITWLVGNGPGGAQDLIARQMAPKMSEELGVDIEVQNIDGGSGVVALTEAHNRPADGYTMVSWSPPGEYLKELQKQLAGFTAQDFTMIGAVNVDPGAIAVPMNSPYQTLQQLIDASKEKTLTVATSGLTNNQAVAALLIFKDLGIKWSLVPYESGAELNAAIVGGTTDLGMRGGGWYDLNGKQLKILAWTTPERLPDYPDIPTLKEVTGSDVTFNSLRGAAVRSDTPEDRIHKLEDVYEKVANDPEIKDLYNKIGFRWQYLSPSEAADQAKVYKDNVNEVADQLDLGK
jgi:tripartite-type tricarboxylate transporter receptor subunit TctC